MENELPVYSPGIIRGQFYCIYATEYRMWLVLIMILGRFDMACNIIPLDGYRSGKNTVNQRSSWEYVTTIAFNHDFRTILKIFFNMTNYDECKWCSIDIHIHIAEMMHDMYMIYIYIIAAIYRGRWYIQGPNTTRCTQSTARCTITHYPELRMIKMHVESPDYSSITPSP